MRIQNNRCDESKGYGCGDCYCASTKKSCRYDWGDFEAVHSQSQTTVIFSWTPDLYRDGDAVAFYTGFFSLENAVVFIGKGLHDATFSKRKILTNKMQDQIEHLDRTVRKFSKTVTVVMRTPLRTRSHAENTLIEQIRAHQLKTWNHSSMRVIDGYEMSQMYTPYDSHHYGHDLHEATLRLLCGGVS